MKQFRIKDNSQTNKEAFSQVSGVVSRIADKTLEQLEKEGVFVFPETIRDADDITKDQMILQSINDTYRSGNVMGFLGVGHERLVIESRFGKGNKDYFFQYLLNRVLEFPNMVNLETDLSTDAQLYQLLLFLFPKYLKSAMRKGVFKTYIRHHYNDANVKGAIEIARHIERNTPFIGNVAYSQREYSYDNQLIELVRHTIEFIKKKPYGNKLLFRVKDEVKLIVDATPGYKLYERQQIIVANKQNVIQHAFYREYRALQRLCILILQHQRHQIGKGSRTIYGILFDGAWLWEEYVAMLIGDVFYHPMNKSGKGAQRLFSTEQGMSLHGLIYPDFIGRNDRNRLIADAKYKPLENIGNKDYLQMLAYMFRFDAKTGCFLYPEATGAKDTCLWLNEGSTYEKNVRARTDVRVVKHGLQIPTDVNTYEDFLAEIHISEQRFKRTLMSCE